MFKNCILHNCSRLLKAEMLLLLHATKKKERTFFLSITIDWGSHSKDFTRFYR